MSKLSMKEVERLLHEAERARHDSFKFSRMIQPGQIGQIARISNNEDMMAVCSQASGRKATSPEWAAFVKACSPEVVMQMCRAAIVRIVEQNKTHEPVSQAPSM